VPITRAPSVGGERGGGLEWAGRGAATRTGDGDGRGCCDRRGAADGRGDGRGCFDARGALDARGVGDGVALDARCSADGDVAAAAATAGPPPPLPPPATPTTSTVAAAAAATRSRKAPQGRAHRCRHVRGGGASGRGGPGGGGIWSGGGGRGGEGGRTHAAAGPSRRPPSGGRVKRGAASAGHRLSGKCPSRATNQVEGPALAFTAPVRRGAPAAMPPPTKTMIGRRQSPMLPVRRWRSGGSRNQAATPRPPTVVCPTGRAGCGCRVHHRAFSGRGVWGGSDRGGSGGCSETGGRAPRRQVVCYRCLPAFRRQPQGRPAEFHATPGTAAGQDGPRGCDDDRGEVVSALVHQVSDLMLSTANACTERTERSPHNDGRNLFFPFSLSILLESTCALDDGEEDDAWLQTVTRGLGLQSSSEPVGSCFCSAERGPSACVPRDHAPATQIRRCSRLRRGAPDWTKL